MKDNWKIADYVDAERRSLAGAIVARQYQDRPELLERYGPAGRTKCVQDTEFHLSYVAAAIRFSSPALLQEYFVWAKGVITAYGVAVEDVDENIVCIRDVLTEELPAEASPTIARYIDDARKALADAPSEIASFLDGDDSLSLLARRYLDALLRSDRHSASKMILDAAAAGVPLNDLYLKVLQRSQREVGRLWQLRQITVAQEHYCSAATQLVMSQLYSYLFNQPRIGRKLVAASVSGELHEMGLRVVADVFEAAGWDTVYLGANTPSESILKTIEQHQPNLLLISATMTFNLTTAAQLIASVRASEVGRNIKILVGGYTCNIDENLWRQLNADGYACDAADALATAERLLEVQTAERERITAAAASLPEALPRIPRPRGDAAIFEELSRLNNDLVTTQRELARKNAELERLHARLTQADKRKDEFLATLAHELRNPLATFRSALDLMQIAGDDPSLHEQIRGMMDRQARHLTQLVEDLLDVSRIKSGKVVLQKKCVALADVVQHAVEITQPLLSEAGHRLNVSLPDEPITLEADPTRLAQSIANLLSNAARYTPGAGTISLTARQMAGHAIVSVKDNGIGISPENLHNIFEMFTQVDESNERSRRGLGIGLMLVKRFTEAHGGTVEAHSDGPGKGSEFVLRLPLAA